MSSTPLLDRIESRRQADEAELARYDRIEGERPPRRPDTRPAWRRRLQPKDLTGTVAL